MHISGIESGKIVPRFDTLLDLVRVLDHDLLMVPRALVPCRAGAHPRSSEPGARTARGAERSLYAADDDEPEVKRRTRDEV